MNFLIRFAQLIDRGDLPNLPNVNAAPGEGGPVANAIQLAAAAAAAISLVVIIIAGIKYIISNGDPNSINNAKNTILYAVIGLVISVMAYSIVAFVIGEVG